MLATRFIGAKCRPPGGDPLQRSAAVIGYGGDAIFNLGPIGRASASLRYAHLESYGDDVSGFGASDARFSFLDAP